MKTAQKILSKVPEITIFFWIVKVLSTGMGEVFSDYLLTTINPVIGVILGLIGLVGSLILQFSVRRYVPWIYWLTVVMISIFGTMAADILHVALGISYQVTTISFVVATAVIFVAWYVSEKTLSIHNIFTKRREFFYWSIVLATFALGTAVGDLTAGPLDLGYLPSGILFVVFMIIPALAHRFFGLKEIPAFWIAYIMTRPLGASFADWMGTPRVEGGLGWGKGPVSLVMTLIIIALVGYLTLTHKKVRNRHVESES
ncbi:hypothetical protein [Paenibacillus sp. NPDC057934]|uniref:COG4705 family protein n=1 Tax=Paenibacillus sp. NPDC057934 TaxID=3346282 RepID=UPI0036D96720